MFKTGDKIAHPMHGAGIIDRIEERIIGGQAGNYYVLKIPAGDMVVMIPEHSCEAIGVRAVVSHDKAEAVISSLSNADAEMTTNWNQRYRENMLRIKSGDLFEVARVVKGLFVRECEKGLSAGERKMLKSAKQILISEIVLSQDSTYDEVESRINAALA